MSNQVSSNINCRTVCIICGVIAAAIAWYVLRGSLSTFPLLIVALLVLLGVSYLLYKIFCGAKEVSDTVMAAGASSAAAAVGLASASDSVKDKSDDAGEKSDGSSAATASNSSAKTSTSKRASAKTSSAGSSGAKKTTAKTTVKKAAATKKTASAKSAKTSTAKSTTAAKSSSASTRKSASKAASAGKTPAKAAASSKSSTGAKKTTKAKSAAKAAGPQLFTSRPSEVDDLKLIAGVGPKLEGVLNEIGVYQYKQVASWKKTDIAHVDDKLKFKGRIERDDWVKQAKALAKGGEAEYIKVFGKKPR